MDLKIRFFNDSFLGVMMCQIGQEKGEYTHIPSVNKWIQTKDLYKTEEEAEKATKAKFYGE